MSVVAEATRASQPELLNVDHPVEEDRSLSAMDMVKLAKQIQNKPLPIFKQTLNTIQSCDNRDDAPIPLVVNALLHDPCYTKALFSEVNIRRLAYKRAPISSLNHAVLLLGIPRILEIGKSLPTFASIRDKKVKRNIYQVLKCLYHAGVQARQLIVRHEKQSAQTAFVNAQLRDLYLVGLWLYTPSEIATLFKADNKSNVFGSNGTLTNTGKILAEEWQLPQPIQQSFALKKDAGRLVRTIDFANQISHYAEQSWYSKLITNLISMSAEGLGFTEAGLSHQVHQNALIAARESKAYPSRSAACQLVQIESERNKKYVMKKREEEKVKVEFDLELELKKLLSLGEKKVKLTEILQYSFELIEQISEKHPVAFLLLDSSRTRLKSNFISNFEALNQRIEIRLSKKNVFALLLKKQQSIWVQDKNREKYAALLNSQSSLKLKSKKFIAMSVLIGQKPIGVFYLEATLDHLISKALYNNFVRICQTAIIAMEEVKTHEN